METLSKRFPQIELAEHRYGMDTVETALSAAEDVLTRHQELNGMFACNESTARGALRALESQGRAGAVKLIGFDSSEPLLEGLRNDRIDSLVVQNPYRMGYDGVKTVVAAIRGQQVEQRIDTGVELVTSKNIDTPDIQRLINPGSTE
jgi:ribose transport system substrate-binding protein